MSPGNHPAAAGAGTVSTRLANPTAPGYESATERRIAGPVGAAIAQLVEHLIRNEGVGGSNPSCGTIIFEQLARGLAPGALRIFLRWRTGAKAVLPCTFST
ncbi:hypothetical protein Maq22A_c15180 [Methylobacterium aquaticum]|uniref:Uncharacterized protein n=1 Tax=Methylobacterium aquaticum TaxID=270351 RepID=A0A0C6FCH0_9HYPH|nr:hypothetical protein Maq22A_c15180 [Methylobacterium aquaticum]